VAEQQSNVVADSIREARERLAEELRSLREQLEKLELDLAELRRRHQRTEQGADQQWEAVAQAAASVPQVSPDENLENVLGAVRSLMTCTLPDQILHALTEQAAEWGVRAAVFDVRGKAAWGASAHGFGPKLTESMIRSLIVPLGQDNPFRQVCEIAGHVNTSAEALKKNRNVLEKLKPAPGAPILLLPVRSGGEVSAVFYADPGDKGDALPANALKILAEFAGAQLDRLIALSGGIAPEEISARAGKPAEAETPVEEASQELAAQVAGEGPNGAAVAEPPAMAPPSAAAIAESPAEAPVPAPTAGAPRAEEAKVPAVAAGKEVAPAPPPAEAAPTPVGEQVAAPPPPAPAGFDISQLSEADQKTHRDARRFAKLLVSEIELYNKSKVADGRKNKDLYKRLKSDIDRSRKTFEKRFGKSLGKEVDYFHEELVKNLATNDATTLGSDYPGPAS